jgi:ribosome-binding factor A
MNKQRSGREASQRQLRVGEVLRQRLSDVLHRFDFEPKALKRATLTVTEVRISPDLRRATAFVMPLGGDNAAAIVTLLNQEVPRLKKPVLSGLRVDDSFDRAAEMDDLLAQNDVQRDLSQDEKDG